MKTVTFDPELWQLVPKQVTQLMAEAARNEATHPQHGDDRWDMHRWQSVYNAFRRAAPQPPEVDQWLPIEWKSMVQKLIQHGRDEVTRCGGNKCREPNCESCCGEDDANEYVQSARDDYAKAAAMLAAAPTHKESNT